MADPVEFPSSTPAFAIPLLFAGQTQKEFYVNHAFSLIDSILQRGVVESTSTAPTAPADGGAYRILANAEGPWTGHDGSIAVYVGGAWQFVAPIEGMSVFDRAEGKWLVYQTAWQSADAYVAPTGGAIVDNEARAAVDSLASALRAVGILPPV